MVLERRLVSIASLKPTGFYNTLMGLYNPAGNKAHIDPAGAKGAPVRVILATEVTEWLLLLRILQT